MAVKSNLVVAHFSKSSAVIQGALHWVTKQIVTPPLPHLTSEGVAGTGFILHPITSTKKVKKRIGLICLQFLSFRSQPYSEGIWLTQGNEKGNMKNELLDDLVKAGDLDQMVEHCYERITRESGHRNFSFLNDSRTCSKYNVTLQI